MVIPTESEIMSARLPSIAIVAAVALLAAAALSSCGDDDDAKTPAAELQAWVAISPAAGSSDTGPMVIFEASNPAATTNVGPDGHYVGLRWSPDGTRLAAVELRDNSLHLVVFERAHPASSAVDIPGDWMDYAWSPDSTRILAVSSTKLEVFDNAGKPMGAVDVPQRADGAHSYSRATIRTWSADSAHAAMFVNEHLLLIDRKGHGQAIDPASSGLDIGGRGFQLYGWKDPTHIRGAYTKPFGPDASATPPTPEPKTVEITVRGDNLTWRLSAFDPNAFLSLYPRLDDAAATSMAHSLAFQSVTADGSAVLTEADRTAAGAPGAITYWLGSQPHTIDLSTFSFPPTAVPLLRTRAIDIVLVH